MFRLFLLLTLIRCQEVEIQSLEEINIEDIDENGADFAVLGDTSHIDHREIDEGSREARGWGEQHDWVTLLDAMIEGWFLNLQTFMKSYYRLRIQANHAYSIRSSLLR